ncbi:MAG: zinc ribbon domain-containing protein, partial [Candidatus Methanomethylophilaceae archaeon]|nr:zinc ribbon domain-containing protein [Candidatus Methanomethylophilaceae archaeon]
MTCDRCDQAAKDGYDYCPKCGRSLRGCEMCRTYADQGYEYCGNCGKRLKEKDDRTLEKAVFIAVPFVVAMLAIEAAGTYLPPVYRGMERPLLTAKIFQADYVHGSDGLGEMHLPA